MSIFNNPTKPNCSTLMSSCNCYFIKGCTTTSADNYNPLAECDDGSCVFTIPGCTDNTADNFNQHSNSDDGSCVFNTGNSYNNGNLECWNDSCPNPSVVSNPDWTSCPANYPFANAPVCAPSLPITISLDNLVGVYNSIDCVGSVDINITNMPVGSSWNLRKEELINVSGLSNPIWAWTPSMGYITQNNYLTPSQSFTALCPGRYYVSVYKSGSLIMSKSLVLNPPSSLPAIEVLTTYPSSGNCNGGVKFIIRQRCHPIAPPWNNCNMSSSNRASFVIKDSLNNIVIDSISDSYGNTGNNYPSANYTFTLQPSGSNRTTSFNMSNSRPGLNINLCSGNYSLELIRNSDSSVLETTTFTIQ